MSISLSIKMYIESLEVLSYGQIVSTKFPMVVHSLEVNKDPFHPKEENEEWFGL